MTSLRSARAWWVLVLASLLAAAVGAPAAAHSTETQATSSHGSQARCRYEVTQAGKYGWTEAQLRRIVVTPPTIYGLSRGQTVGWRFVVRRSIDGGAAKLTYRSPIQRATAGPSRAADFSKMGVAVGLPTPPTGDDWPEDWDLTDVHYRVVLKAFWYRADGSIQQRVSHSFANHRHFVDGTYEFSEEYCAGEILQFFDGPTG